MHLLAFDRREILRLFLQKTSPRKRFVVAAVPCSAIINRYSSLSLWATLVIALTFEKLSTPDENASFIFGRSSRQRATRTFSRAAPIAIPQSLPHDRRKCFGYFQFSQWAHDLIPALAHASRLSNSAINFKNRKIKTVHMHPFEVPLIGKRQGCIISNLEQELYSILLI